MEDCNLAGMLMLLMMMTQQWWLLLLLLLQLRVRLCLHHTIVLLLLLLQQPSVGADALPLLLLCVLHLLTLLCVCAQLKEEHRLELPWQVFIAPAMAPGDPMRKPAPGMWRFMAQHCNGGTQPGAPATSSCT